MTDTSHLVPLAGFVLGYGAILVTPGPNVLAIGSIATLRGLRATWPLCAGIACGASLLAACICAAASWGKTSSAIDHGARAVAAVLLLYVAARLVLRRPPDETESRALDLSTRDAIATFVAGVATAATNPITAAFFASQFLGALPDAASRAAALGVVPALALSFGLAVAYILSRPFAQRAVLVWHRPFRIASATVIAAGAAIVGLPLLGVASETGFPSAAFAGLTIP
jgi:threonine/homoserine/homoserine lactone efflux protein